MKSVGALIVTVLSSLSQAVCAQTGDAVDRLRHAHSLKALSG
jgi:hypothetical protein